MKGSIRTASIVALGVAMLAGAGCNKQTKREQVGEAGIANMNNISFMLSELNGRIDSAAAAATQLMVQGVDKETAATKLDNEIAALNKSAGRVRDEAASMRSRGDEYFIEWEREHARESAGDARAESVTVSQAERSRYRRLMNAMELTGDDFRSFTDGLSALAGTAAGGNFSSTAITSQVESVRLGAVNAKNAVTALQNNLNEILAGYRADHGG